jgi:protein-S-isoprenylcysteine O-methyltransferase Ste14
MTVPHAAQGQPPGLQGRRPRLGLRALIGSGDRIDAVVLPFLVVGILLNLAFPEAFRVGGPPRWLTVVSAVLLALGVVVWAWSLVLILTKVRAGELVTSGPYAVVRHPLYTGVALLVLPWLGFLFDSWLGAALGVALYAASRRYAPDEEAELADDFGAAWDAYRDRVMLPWL